VYLFSLFSQKVPIFWHQKNRLTLPKSFPKVTESLTLYFIIASQCENEGEVFYEFIPLRIEIMIIMMISECCRKESLISVLLSNTSWLWLISIAFHAQSFLFFVMKSCWLVVEATSGCLQGESHVNTTCRVKTCWSWGRPILADKEILRKCMYRLVLYNFTLLL